MTPGREPLREVTDSEIRAFTDDGVVHLTGILSRAWIDLLDVPVDETIADPSVTADLTTLGKDLAADLGSDPLSTPVPPADTSCQELTTGDTMRHLPRLPPPPPPSPSPV